jgi:hypothetical protein
VSTQKMENEQFHYYTCPVRPSSQLLHVVSLLVYLLYLLQNFLGSNMQTDICECFVPKELKQEEHCQV